MGGGMFVRSFPLLPHYSPEAARKSQLLERFSEACRGTEAPPTFRKLLRGRELSLASSYHIERNDRGEGADERSGCDRRRGAEEIGHEAGLQAAEWNHSTENERPDSHDSPA